MSIEISGMGITITALRKTAEALSPQSPAIKAALGVAAMQIVYAAKKNIQRQQIVDQGGLINSIKYQFQKTGTTETSVQVGSFGVVYAAMNEFGGPVSDRMRRAMFAAMRRRGLMQPGVAGKLRGGKGVIVNGYWRPRPYLIPAFEANLDAAVDLIAGAIVKEMGE